MWGQPPSAVRSSAARLVFCSGRGLTQPDSPFLSRHCYPLIPMLEFCDIVFPYRVPADATPVVGARVLVPFRQQRMTGIVVELHDRKPSVTTKSVLAVLDVTPVLDEQLLQLGRWIADYYLAPLGEVFRTMLPLNAEFKRSIGYRLTDEGQMALHLAGMSGSSARSKRTPEEQEAEFRVLDYLANCISESEPRIESPARNREVGPGGLGTSETGKGTA